MSGIGFQDGGGAIEYQVGEFRTSDADLWRLLDAIASGDVAQIRAVMGKHSYLPPGYRDMPLDDALRADAERLRRFIETLRRWWRRAGRLGVPFTEDELRKIDAAASVRADTRLVDGRIEPVRRVDAAGVPWHAIQQLAQRRKVTKQDLAEDGRLCPYCGRTLSTRQRAVCSARDCRREHQRRRTAKARSRPL